MTASGAGQRYPEPTVGALTGNSEGHIPQVPEVGDLNTISNGHVELGETLVEALKPEIREVGLEIYDIGPQMSQEAIFSPQFHERRHFISCNYTRRCRDDQVDVDGAEITGCRWFWPREPLGLNLDDYTRRMIEKYLAAGHVSGLDGFSSREEDKR